MDEKITRKEYTLDWSQSKAFLVYSYSETDSFLKKQRKCDIVDR